MDQSSNTGHQTDFPDKKKIYSSTKKSATKTVKVEAGPKSKVYDLIYVPSEDLVIPLTSTEVDELRAEAQKMDSAIKKVHEAYDSGDKERFRAAKKEFAAFADANGLSQVIPVTERDKESASPFPDKGGAGMLSQLSTFVEVIHFGDQKWSYVRKAEVDSYKDGGRKAFDLLSGRPIAAEQQAGGSAESEKHPLRARSMVVDREEKPMVDSKAFKEKLSDICVKIENKWTIADGQFSIRHLLSPPGSISVDDRTIAAVDNWIQQLNNNLEWSWSQKQKAYDDALKILDPKSAKAEENSSESSLIATAAKNALFAASPTIALASAATNYIFSDDEDHSDFDAEAFGKVSHAIDYIWAEDESEKKWLNAVKAIRYPKKRPGLDEDEAEEAFQKKLAEIRQELTKQFRARKDKIPESRYSVSAKAQLMRYACGVSTVASFNPKKGNFAARAEAKLDLAIFDGKAEGKAMLPDEKGKCIDLKYRKTKTEVTWNPRGRTEEDRSMFEFNETFLTVEEMGNVSRLYDQLQFAQNPVISSGVVGGALKVQIQGHADQVGTEVYNQGLSERRAQVVYGYLRQQPGYWLEMFQVPKEFGGWGVNEVKVMLTACGYSAADQLHGDPGVASGAAVKSFQGKFNRRPQDGPVFRGLVPSGTIHLGAGASSDPTLKALIGEYMTKGPLTQPIPQSQFHFDKPYAGFGESVPAPGHDTPYRDKENRRVEFLLFEPECKETEEEKEVQLGDLRLVLDAFLSGYVGANLALAGHIDFSSSTEVLQAKGLRAKAQEAGAGAGIEGEVFAGAKAEVGCKGTLQWKCPEPIPPEYGSGPMSSESNEASAPPTSGLFPPVPTQNTQNQSTFSEPKSCLSWSPEEPDLLAPDMPLQPSHPEPVETKPEFVDLGSVGYTVTAYLGGTLKGSFKIGFDPESNKFMIKVAASAALGPGFGGELAFTVGVKHTYSFIALVYTQLRDHDFNFVDLFESEDRIETFDLFCSWSYKMLLMGNLAGVGTLFVGALGMKAMGDGRQLIREWEKAWEEETHARQLVENICKNAEVVRYTTPEVKGRILYLLIKPEGLRFDVATFFDSLYTKRKQAVHTVLSWVQSRRDLQEVLEHMGIDIPKSEDAHMKTERMQANKRLVIEYLEGIGVTETSWRGWYEALPEKAGTSAGGAVQIRHSPMAII